MSRFTYGSRPEDIDAAVKMGLEKWFLQQLKGNLADDSLDLMLKSYDAINLSNTHVNQGKDKGVFERNVADLSNSMTAFWADMANYQDDLTVMTMTEFGRTVKQNGTSGTDHGRASCNFILGNNVNGGIVHGNVQSLAIENLEDGRDLAVTTDFRNVFNEFANKHLLINNYRVLFPGFEGKGIGVMNT